MEVECSSRSDVDRSGDMDNSIAVAAVAGHTREEVDDRDNHHDFRQNECGFHDADLRSAHLYTDRFLLDTSSVVYRQH